MLDPRGLQMVLLILQTHMSRSRRGVELVGQTGWAHRSSAKCSVYLKKICAKMNILFWGFCL